MACSRSAETQIQGEGKQGSEDVSGEVLAYPAGFLYKMSLEKRSEHVCGLNMGSLPEVLAVLQEPFPSCLFISEQPK